MNIVNNQSYVSEQVPVSPVSPTEKPKNWFKILQIIIGFLIVLGLFGSIYLLLRKEKQKPISQITPTPTQTAFLPSSPPTQTALLPTPTPDPTADWKTYVNEKYGYSVRYPTDWIFQPDKQVPEEIVSFMKDLYSLAIYSGSATTGMPPGKVPSAVRAISVGNQQVAKEVYDGLLELIKFPEEFKVNQIVIRYKDGIYNKEYSDLFNQILSTFKFLQ